MLHELNAGHLSQLKNCSDPEEIGRMLDSFSKHPLRQPAVIKSYHDLLLYYCAFPPDGHVYKMAIEELERLSHEVKHIMEQHNQRLHLGLMGSGLPYTDLLCHYSFTLTAWLLKKFPEAVELDSSEADPETIRRILYLFLPHNEYQRTTQGNLHLRNRIKWLTGVQDGNAQLKWLVKIFEESPLPLEVKEEFYEQLKVFVRWTLKDPFFSRSFLHAETSGIHYTHHLHRNYNAAQLIRQPLDLDCEIKMPTRRKLVDIMKATLAFQYKEIDPFTYASERELEIFDAGKGLKVALVGMINEKKLSIENYIGFMAFRNGIPVAYGGGWLFGQRCKIGINIFEPFRRGESAWIFTQVMRVYYSRHGARHFIVKPFQFGKGNPEGLRTGAFWFYYKLGFRPADPAIRELAAEEWKKKQEQPSHRTTLVRLKKFAASNLELKLQKKIWPDYDAAELSEKYSLEMKS